MGAVLPRAPRRIAARPLVDDASGVSYPAHSRIGSAVLIGSDRTFYIVYMLDALRIDRRIFESDKSH
jgi:hypothetical protein